MQTAPDGVVGKWARVAANRVRLRLMTTLASGTELPHAQLADELGLSTSGLSTELRLLEHFNLVRRDLRGHRAYWLAPLSLADSQEHLEALNQWLYRQLGSPDNELTEQLHDTLFSSLTIFTCARRTALLHILQNSGGTMTLSELRRRLHMSFPTLLHHLDKLERRGIVKVDRQPGRSDSICFLILHFQSQLQRDLYNLVTLGELPPTEGVAATAVASAGGQRLASGEPHREVRLTTSRDHLEAESGDAMDLPGPQP